MSRRFMKANIAVTMLVAIAGCSSAPLMPPERAGVMKYRLDTGDKLRVTVFNDASLSGEFAVSDGGYLSFPLIGNLFVKGKTVDEAQALVHDSLAKGYVNDPRVTMEVIAYRPYYINGEVVRGGEVPFSAGLTVTQAIAAAGGYTYRGDKKNIFITRKGMGAEFRVIPETTYVMPGDVIRVGERYF